MLKRCLTVGAVTLALSIGPVESDRREGPVTPPSLFAHCTLPGQSAATVFKLGARDPMAGDVPKARNPLILEMLAAGEASLRSSR